MAINSENPGINPGRTDALQARLEGRSASALRSSTQVSRREINTANIADILKGADEALEGIKRADSLSGNVGEVGAGSIGVGGSGNRTALVKRAAKFARDQVVQTGEGLGYVAKNPHLWPGIVKKGAKDWASNTSHPFTHTAWNALRHRDRLTTKELYWYGGAAVGAVETFAIYNSMPPGAARLVRAGVNVALTQLAAGVFYLAEVNEKGKIYKDIPDKAVAEARVKIMEERRARNISRKEAFLKGMAAGNAWATVFTTSGLMEKGAEVLLHVAGASPEQLAQGGFNWAGEKFSSFRASGTLVLNEEAFIKATREVIASENFREPLNSFDNQVFTDTLDKSGLKIEDLSDEVKQKIWRTALNQSNDLFDKELFEGAQAALTANPDLSMDEAAKAGMQRVYGVLQALQDDPEKYQKLIDENKIAVDKIMQEESLKSATPSAAVAAPATPAEVKPFLAPAATPEPTAAAAATATPEPAASATSTATQSPSPTVAPPATATQAASPAASPTMVPAEATPKPAAIPDQPVPAGAPSKPEDLMPAAPAQPDPSAKPAIIKNVTDAPSAEELHKAARIRTEDVLRTTVNRIGKDMNWDISEMEEAEKALKGAAAEAVGIHIAQTDEVAREAIKAMGEDPDKISGAVYDKVAYTVLEEMQSEASELLAAGTTNNIVDVTEKSRSIIDKGISSDAFRAHLVNEAKIALLHETVKEQAASIVNENKGAIFKIIDKAIEDNPVFENANQIPPETYKEITANVQRQLTGDLNLLNESYSTSVIQPEAKLGGVTAQIKQELAHSLADSSNPGSVHNHLKDTAQRLVDNYAIEQTRIVEAIDSTLKEGGKLKPGLGTVVQIKQGDTISDLVAASHYNPTWGPKDAGHWGGILAVNYESLSEDWATMAEAPKWPDSHHFPVELKSLYPLWKLAESGDRVALQKLLNSLQWILKVNGGELVIPNDAGIAEIKKVLAKMGAVK